MNTRLDSHTDVKPKHETSSGDYIDPVQSPPTERYPSTRLGRLASWMAARVKAHEDRVSSLRVYSQHRLDGRVTGERKVAEPASQ